MRVIILYLYHTCNNNYIILTPHPTPPHHTTTHYNKGKVVTFQDQRETLAQLAASMKTTDKGQGSELLGGMGDAMSRLSFGGLGGGGGGSGLDGGKK